MALINPFASKETFFKQLKNVGDVLSIALNPFSKDKIVADVKNPIAKSVLEAGANNPYTTALLGASSVSKTVTTGIVKAVTSASTKTKVALGATALVATPAIVSSPKTASSAINVVSGLTPESLLRFGSNLGKVVETPSIESVKNLYEGNKVITTGLAVAGVAIAGKAVVPALASGVNTLVTSRNTKAIKKATEATIKAPDYLPTADTKVIVEKSPTATIPSNPAAPVTATNPVPSEPSTSPITAKTKLSSQTRRKKRKSRVCCTGKEKSIKRFNLKMSVNGRC